MYVILLPLFLLVGCTTNAVDINEIHDDRMTAGCIVVSADGQSYFKLARGELCKAVCSDDLPEDFVFHYDRNGCVVNINNGEKDD